MFTNNELSCPVARQLNPEVICEVVKQTREVASKASQHTLNALADSSLERLV